MTNSIKEYPDQHGFVLMGSNNLYIDHLPMFFMQNHMYHIILEINIPESAKQSYLEDQKNNPEIFYILGNLETDKFTLPSVAIGEKISFQADIFRSLPNDPNKDKPLIHNITTEIKRIIRFRYFDFNQDYPKNLTYVLFGDEHEAFLSHYLTKQPDFMQDIQLMKTPDWLQLEQLKMGVNINFIEQHDTPTPCKSPFLQGDSYNVMYQGQEDTSFQVKIARNIFFSTQVPNHPDPCNKQ
jgi:uncharacterized protein (DUF2249 family)